MSAFDTSDLRSRLQERALAWSTTVDDVVQTSNALLAFGHRGDQPVVLKIVRLRSDEGQAGEVLAAFAGRGVVRLLERVEGAVLLERLLPGTALVDCDLDDDEATAILAGVIGQMSPDPPPSDTPTIEAWGASFERYVATGRSAIPASLLEAAQRTYSRLCATQAAPRLLHGDLQHHNVLLDSHRGWVAIDPKGVVGEVAYEVGAALRNPCERPELVASPATIRKRADCFERVLGLDADRILAWAFAQAVLAAIWELEDDEVLTAGAGWVSFANAVRPMLGP
jgi:streptomycin 6-kinase